MTSLRVRASALIAAAGIGAGALALQASVTKFFQTATQADFLEGEVNSLSLDTRGQLTLGPATELVYETAAPFLWALLPAPDGSLYVGTGNEGRVFRVGPDDAGATVYDAAELEAHALALAPDGALYVGSSPDGRIYKVEAGGASRVFFEPGEKYIWDLTVDRRGVLYAATGEQGDIYRIAPDGEGSRFYQAKATHATALAVDPAGNLLVGTESPGRVLRVDAEGKGFVLLDTPLQEIRSLRFGPDGMLYAAAVGGDSGGRAPPSPSRPEPGDEPSTPAEPAGGSVPTVSVQVTSVTVGDTPDGSSAEGSTRAERGPVRGAVFRIAPDGLWDRIWESREDSPYDLAFDDEGRLIVGTGSNGKIFRLEGNPLRPTLIARAPARQVTALHRDGKGRLYYATANPGKIFRLSPDRSLRGTYESEPRDAGMVATWGNMSWRGTVPKGARIEISTRSGNTPTPDETWSAWSEPYREAAGSPITSPNARYLQWRAALTRTGETPTLTSVTAAYLQRNLPPLVQSLTVHPPGIVFQKPFSAGDPELAGFENQTTPERELVNEAMTSQQGSGSSALGRRTYQKGLQTLAWRADDENDDQLSFEVRYRREGDAAWKVLRSGLTEPVLVWDTTTVPNGTYFVRIVASDAPSNAPDTALSGERDSGAFEIDNTAPQVAIQGTRVESGRTLVTLQVRDDHSPVQRLEYSQDGRQWRPAFPADGIADSTTERYELSVEGLLGPRGLTLRATDRMNNVATAQVEPPAVR